MNHNVNKLINYVLVNLEDSVKFLRMYIDNNLNLDVPIVMVCKRLFSGIFILRRLAKFYNMSVVLFTVYYGIIHPNSSCSVPIWENSSNVKNIFKI